MSEDAVYSRRVNRVIENMVGGTAWTRKNVRATCRAMGMAHADAVYREGLRPLTPAEQGRDKVEAFYEEAIVKGIGEPLVLDSFQPLAGRFTTWAAGHTTVPLNPPASSLRGFPCPPSPMADVETMHLITPNPVLVLSDLHVPFHDAAFIDQSLRVALAEGCDTGILAGDLMDNEQWHRSAIDSRSPRTWQQNIVLARSVMAHLCSHIPNWYVIFGNHDDWITKMLKGQAETEWMYKHLFPDLPVKWSALHQMIVTSANIDGPAIKELGPGNTGHEFRILHGEHFSATNPMGVMVAYAHKFQSSVIGAHQHYAMQWETGPYQLILNGGSFAREKLEYAIRAPMKAPATQRGFTIIKGGRATLYPEWDALSWKEG